MQTTRTATGYQLDGMEVDSKPHSRLPTQQARTLLFVAQGYPQKEIAEEMGVKVGTVKKACSDLAFKFHTRTMRETVHTAIKEGVLRYVFCIFLCLISSMSEDVERIRYSKTTRVTKAAKVRGARRTKKELVLEGEVV